MSAPIAPVVCHPLQLALVVFLLIILAHTYNIILIALGRHTLQHTLHAHCVVVVIVSNVKFNVLLCHKYTSCWIRTYAFASLTTMTAMWLHAG